MPGAYAGGGVGPGDGIPGVHPAAQEYEPAQRSPEAPPHALLAVIHDDDAEKEAAKPVVRLQKSPH